MKTPRARFGLTVLGTGFVVAAGCAQGVTDPGTDDLGGSTVITLDSGPGGEDAALSADTASPPPLGTPDAGPISPTADSAPPPNEDDDASSDDSSAPTQDANAPDTNTPPPPVPDASADTGSEPDTGGGTVVPTTCAEAYGAVGCCAGNTVYWCTKGTTSLTVKPCSSTQVCGWDSTAKYYYCVAPPGGADPGGNPIACQ